MGLTTRATNIRVVGYGEHHVFASTVDDSSPMADHIGSLAALPGLKKLRRAVPPDGCELVMNIAVFFDAPMAQIDIPIADVFELGLPLSRIEVSWYPWAGDE